MFLLDRILRQGGCSCLTGYFGRGGCSCLPGFSAVQAGPLSGTSQTKFQAGLDDVSNGASLETVGPQGGCLLFNALQQTRQTLMNASMGVQVACCTGSVGRHCEAGTGDTAGKQLMVYY